MKASPSRKSALTSPHRSDALTGTVAIGILTLYHVDVATVAAAKATSDVATP